MGMNAFLTIGNIKGSARQKTREGKIVVAGVQAKVDAELDWKSGRPEKDKTKHVPMVITKGIDAASPALHVALKNGNKFNGVTIEFWRMPPAGGLEENYFTVVMDGVQVVGMKTIMVNNTRPENLLIPEQEELSLSYEKIGYKFPGSIGGAEMHDAEFDVPYEAKAKEIAIDAAKDAGKVIAAEVYALWKGGTTPPAEEKK